ncbi:MAG TPA: PIN domain-containing protein [Terriglobales bacterium]|nr:PIN domain-containing protein [Terriglobales bacterium]
MIAADTCTWIAYLNGEAGDDTGRLDQALADSLVTMVPVVLTELLSAPLPPAVSSMLLQVPRLEPLPDFWRRAGKLRAGILAQRRKARLGDALIAQFCLDHGVPLLTRDRDFRGFAAAGKLQIVLPIAAD